MRAHLSSLLLVSHTERQHWPQRNHESNTHTALKCFKCYPIHPADVVALIFWYDAVHLTCY
jgi:hypothetical protein